MSSEDIRPEPIMTPARAAERLAANAQVFTSLLAGVTTEQARWSPAADQWSLLEVINHLADEERSDFRQRIDLMLHQPGMAWPPIHPSQWVEERHYNARDLAESLDDFLVERRRSVAWLQDLAAIDLEVSYAHQSGALRAGDMLGSWLAHDLLHVRQMARLHYQYLSLTMRPYSVGYAGDW